MIRESALKRAVKEAWRGKGYTIYITDTTTTIMADAWMVEYPNNRLPRSILGLIVEQCGDLPGPGEAWRIADGTEPQRMLLDSAKELVGWWTSAEDVLDLRWTPVVIYGSRIYQAEDRAATVGLEESRTALLERVQPEAMACDLGQYQHKVRVNFWDAETDERVVLLGCTDLEEAASVYQPIWDQLTRCPLVPVTAQD